VEKSGLYVCGFRLLQKFLVEKHVDLTWAVLGMRKTQPKFLSGPKQMQFLFNVIQDYYKKELEDYANF
jgi:hypothetical protein